MYDIARITSISHFPTIQGLVYRRGMGWVRVYGSNRFLVRQGLTRTRVQCLCGITGCQSELDWHTLTSFLCLCSHGSFPMVKMESDMKKGEDPNWRPHSPYGITVNYPPYTYMVVSGWYRSVWDGYVYWSVYIWYTLNGMVYRYTDWCTDGIWLRGWWGGDVGSICVVCGVSHQS